MSNTQVQNKYIVTLENYDGKCKRVSIYAFDMYDAMAKTQKNGWQPVEVVEVK